MKFYIRYNYIFQIGYNEHRVELFEKYTKDEGLIGAPVHIIKEGQKQVLLNKLKKLGVEKEQLSKISELGKLKEDGIIGPDAEYYSW